MTAACRSFFLDAGPRGQRLCVHHPAQGVVTPRGQVLLLPPFGEELNKSRRMLALAARAYARAGYEVLLVDLLGCGDSSGDFGDATWDDWVADLRLAADWLGEHAPRPDAPLWLWAVRAGALFIPPLADALDRPLHLLLWQPVTAGKLQLQQFLRLKVAADLVGGQAKGAMQALRQQLDRDEAVEIAGYRLSPALAAGLDQAQFKPDARFPRLAWFETSTRDDPTLTPAAAMAVQAWTEQGCAVQAAAVSGPSFWAATEIEEAPALIMASVEALDAPWEAVASTASAAPHHATRPPAVALPSDAATATATAATAAATTVAAASPTSAAPAWRDTALTIPCGAEALLGLLSEPADTAATGHEGDLGVLLVVGGPQYRVGCHRQFTLLGRALAGAGVPCLRIDYRGMGDATGELRSFEDIDDDITAAIDHWQRERPGLRRVVIWGLCDAASAALLHVHRLRDARIAGLCLANPWVRTEASLARAQVRHYYLDRLRKPAFWRKLLTGGVGLSAVRELIGKLGQARGAAQPASGPARGGDRSLHYTAQMAAGLRSFNGPVLLMLSGDDLVAREFLDLCRDGGPAWQGLLGRPQLRREDLPEADHTFASAAWRAQVEAWTLAFAQALATASTPPPAATRAPTGRPRVAA